MAGKCSGKNLPLLEHKHIKILDQSGLKRVDNNVTLILKIAEFYFMSKTRSKSRDTITKKEAP